MKKAYRPSAKQEARDCAWFLAFMVLLVLAGSAWFVYAVEYRPLREARAEAERSTAALNSFVREEDREINAFMAARLTELLDGRYPYRRTPGPFQNTAFGISEAVLEKIEAGERPMTAAELRGICAYFRITVSDFLDERLPIGLPLEVVALVRLRHSRGLSRASFGAAAGLSADAVAAVESGKRTLTASEWMRLHDAFGTKAFASAKRNAARARLLDGEHMPASYWLRTRARAERL